MVINSRAKLTSDRERRKTEEDLRAYYRQDTLGMVKLLEKMRGLAESPPVRTMGQTGNRFHRHGTPLWTAGRERILRVMYPLC